VNQTLVRSINTTVVALLPIASILVIGFLFLGPGTLLDLALALFVGIAVGAYSSIFIATPLLVHMRNGEPEMVELTKKAQRYQDRHGGVVLASDAAPVEHRGDDASTETTGEEREKVTAAPRGGVVRETHKYASSGPRNQPKRPPRSRR
jgi:preprotein translocase subunit SecF